MKQIRFEGTESVVIENGKVLGRYPTLQEAIDSNPITMPYCPVCFMNADQCTDQALHMEYWEWS